MAADTTAGVTVGDATHTGTVKFLGANTYGGGTTVAYGTLQVNNTTGSGTGSGTVSVNSGATLGGSGTISGNVFVAGATLPGATGLTNTIGGNLTYSGGAQANFDLSSSAANGGNDQIVLSGAGGNLTGNSVNVGINCGPYLDQAHSYVLFNLTGSGAFGQHIEWLQCHAGLAGHDTFSSQRLSNSKEWHTSAAAFTPGRLRPPSRPAASLQARRSTINP